MCVNESEYKHKKTQTEHRNQCLIDIKRAPARSYSFGCIEMFAVQVLHFMHLAAFILFVEIDTIRQVHNS